jgi:sulfide:quinone oxidoreductase
LGEVDVNSPSQVLVAGGGVAGLEAVLALQALAPSRFAIELVTPQRHVISRSLLAGPPFLRATATRVELAEIADERGFRVTRDVVELVDPGSHSVLTQGGVRRSYDILVLALGTWPTAAVTGAVPFRGLEDLGAVLAGLEATTSVAFVARSASMWTAPLYALALQAVDWAADRQAALDVLVVTAERAGERVRAELLDAGVVLMADTVADRFRDGALELAGGGRVEVGLAVALPHLTGRAVRGLPSGAANGFIHVDESGSVAGVDDVYAIGDMTGRRLPAAEQAGLAAGAIAAR